MAREEAEESFGDGFNSPRKRGRKISGKIEDRALMLGFLRFVTEFLL